MEYFASSFLLLQSEGYLFRSSLLAGLTALRHATSSNPGNFWSGFFQLSVGIERALKCVVVLDHIGRTGLPPTNRELRNFGHDIQSLVATVVALPVDKGPNPLGQFEAASVEIEILAFLSEFAVTTRYYNLDALSRGNAKGSPLPRWHSLLQRLVRQNIPPERVSDIAQQSVDLAAVIDSSVRVVAHDLDGSPLDVARMLAAPRLQDLGCKYAVWHMIVILAALYECLRSATWRAHEREDKSSPASVPYMYEFLTFALLDKSYVLRKRRWP